MNTDTSPLFLVIDLFGGGGGDATGWFNASINGNKIALVIACINHDESALKTHETAYPDVKHYKEDVGTADLSELKSVVSFYQNIYPSAKLVLWGSFPCPHFSKALGGQPKDEAIRTMARSLYMNYDPATAAHIPGDSYIQVLQPDYIIIENVEEFMSWGPLCKKGKPIVKKNGMDWLDWKRNVCSFGYADQWKELNSADFGANTSRNRLFGVFAKNGLPIAWPAPTHAKNPTTGDLFSPLLPWKAVKECIDFNDKGRCVITRKKKLVDNTIRGIIKGIKKFALNGEEYFLFHYYGKSFSTSIHSSCPSFRTKPSAYLIQAFIHNPSHGGNCSSINKPCPVIVARQDKAPLRIVTCVKGKSTVTIQDSDTPAYKELKELMIENGISEVLYRRLTIDEKKLIQGFPANYQFFGTQAAQDKQIGNSVVPVVAQVIAEAIGEKLLPFLSEKVA